MKLLNRAVFITTGIVLIIIIFIIWLFLFIKGAPASTSEIFSDLGIIEPVERTADPQTDSLTAGEGRAVLDLTGNRLQQVTLAPVAGFAIASTSGDAKLVRYVERGTGYIFDINLNSGLQTQVSPTTIPGVTEAYFSPDLKNILLVTEVGERKVVLLKLTNSPEGVPEQIIIDAQAENLQFLDNDTLTYTKNTFTGTVAYVYDLDENTVTEKFRLSLPDATVVTTAKGDTFAYPKPTLAFMGGLYEVVGNNLTPVGNLGLGLVPFIGSEYTFLNQIDTDDHYQVYRLPDQKEQLALMLPQKCVEKVTIGLIWCGAPKELPTSSYVEDWYKGLIQSNDVVWQFSTTAETSVIAIPEEIIGRQLDVVQPVVTKDADHLFFINKFDSALWLLNL